MTKTIHQYNKLQTAAERKICSKLAEIIDGNLKFDESKIWHAHPVWFIEGNPIVGYGKLKGCIRLMFWSGADFSEADLKPGTGKFKDASIRYTDVSEINEKDVKRWLKKAKTIQWDYKNVYKRKGKLIKII
jgi:hypothetical protein